MEIQNIFLFFLFLASFLIALVDVTKIPANGQTEMARKLVAELEMLESHPMEDLKDPGIHFTLGKDYWELGSYDQAIKHFKETLKLDPQRPAAHYDLGLIYYGLKDGANAIRHMKKAQELYLAQSEVEGSAKSRKKLSGFYSEFGHLPVKSNASPMAAKILN
ncbi:MAG: tetratricopeptide repeat protein [Nitrospinaceae bacterium]